MGEVRVIHVGKGEEWRTKEELADRERKSEAYWRSLDDDKRAAMLLIIREALSLLIEDPDVWVPTSIEPKDEERLDIFLSIHLAVVDEEVVKRKLQAERELYEATEGLVQIERDLRERNTQ